jgi:prepilin-type N-terminal cleavage/methylation domain-containing protein
MIVTRHAVARSTRDATRGGFTLMEVLVVAAILVILAGTGTIVLFRYLEDARVSTAKLGVKNLETAVEGYKLSHGGQLPPNLEVLTQAEAGRPAYIDVEGLKDPWQNLYIYEPNTTHPQTGKPLIYSGGPDGASKISNWDPTQ